MKNVNKVLLVMAKEIYEEFKTNPNKALLEEYGYLSSICLRLKENIKENKIEESNVEDVKNFIDFMNVIQPEISQIIELKIYW